MVGFGVVCPKPEHIQKQLTWLGLVNMVSKLDYVPNLPWDIPGWIWDMITFGTSIYPKSEVRFGMYEIRIPVWDIPKLIWDIGSVWATTVPPETRRFYHTPETEMVKLV